MGIGESKDYVTISRQEYETLLDKSDKLFALYSAGVDNWEWIDYAMDMYRDMKKKREE